ARLLGPPAVPDDRWRDRPSLGIGGPGRKPIRSCRLGPSASIKPSAPCTAHRRFWPALRRHRPLRRCHYDFEKLRTSYRSVSSGRRTVAAHDCERLGIDTRGLRSIGSDLRPVPSLGPPTLRLHRLLPAPLGLGTIGREFHGNDGFDGAALFRGAGASSPS